MEADEKKIKDALKRVDIEVGSIYDLVNTSQPYPEAIPILLELLEEDTLSDDQVKEGVIRALAVKEAKGIAGSVLIKEFHKIPKEKMLLRWAIGNTMAEVITEDEVDDVIEIVKDKQNGMARQMFVLALGKVKSDKAEKTLIELLGDDEVVAHALDALGRLKSQKAKAKIEELANHSKSLIREEAKKALKKID